MNLKISYLNVLICMGFVLSNSIELSAQNQDKKRYNEEVTIVGEYRPSITDANKININPKLDETEKVEVPVNDFPVIAKQMNTDIQLQPVQPLDIRFDRRTQTWNNYLKAGIGSYINPYLEFFHNGESRQEFTYGIHAKHYSSNVDIKDIPESKFSHNLIEGEISKNFSDHILNAKAYYQRHGLSYYGLYNYENPASDITLDSIDQAYNYAGFALDFGNYPQDDEAFRYKINADYNFTGDAFEAREHQLKFNVDLNKTFHIFDFSEGEKIGLLAESDNYFYKVKELDNNSNLLKLKPYAQLQYDMFKFYAAADFSFVGGTENKMYFYPDLRAEYEILPKQMVLYAGLKGEVTRNSLKSLTTLNPFLSSGPMSTWTSDKIKFYGGVQGNIASSLDYGLVVSFDSFDQKALFVVDQTSYEKTSLMPLYADLTQLSVEASLAYHLNDKVNARGFIRYNSYSVEDQAEAWQLPKTEIGFHVAATPIERLGLSLDLTNRGKVPVLNFANPSEDLNLESWTDLSIGASYAITDNLNAFIQGNNLLNNKYQIWQNYANQGINVMVGGSVKF